MNDLLHCHALHQPPQWLDRLLCLEACVEQHESSVTSFVRRVFGERSDANICVFCTKQEMFQVADKVESLNNCIDEHQQQAYAQRLDFENAHHGYVESRREQVRLQEELSMKVKALRETQMRSMHEMTEMKRAQELRVDKFSAQKLRESHETLLKLTAQVQELQERMNYLNGEFQDIESNYMGKFSHVPSQPARIPSPRSMLSRDRSMPFDAWSVSETQGNVFVNPRSMFDSSHTLSRNSSLYKCHRCDSSAGKYRATCRER